MSMNLINRVHCLDQWQHGLQKGNGKRELTKCKKKNEMKSKTRETETRPMTFAQSSDVNCPSQPSQWKLTP